MKIKFTIPRPNSEKTNWVYIETDIILAVHETNFNEGYIAIHTQFGYFLVVKNEATEQLYKLVLKNKSLFSKSYTRFGKREMDNIDVKTKWEEGDRYIVFYRNYLPILGGDVGKARIMISDNQSLKIEV